MRNVGLKGKSKLADKWDKHTYIVIDMPDKTIPVYKVQRESGDSSVKSLHRNMLLPFSVIPGKSEVSIPSKSTEPKSPLIQDKLFHKILFVVLKLNQIQILVSLKDTKSMSFLHAGTDISAIQSIPFQI